MKCKRFRILISSYLDGEVTQQEKRDLENHIRTCHICASEMDRLKKIKTILSLKERKEPGDFFETSLLEYIQEREKSFSTRYHLVLRKAAFVTVIVILILGGWLGYRSLVYQKGKVAISDLLFDEELDRAFEEGVLELYYGPPG